MRRLLILCACVAAPLAAAATMHDEWARGAGDRLYLLISRDGREGAVPVASPATGRLYTEGLAEQTVRLEPGEHVIVGTCEAGCDLDVHVYADDGRRVAADTDAWPHALADVEVRQAGTYRVRATMPECSLEPCRYAVGAFRIEN
jgi:hypothetical protein